MDTNSQEPRIYRVPETNMSALQTRIDKLARKCKRIKVQAPTLAIGEPVEVPYKDEDGFTHIRRYFPVTLDVFESPKIDGYEFIAVLSPVTDEQGVALGNVLRAVPGASVAVMDHFRRADNYCDHCKTNRRRLETFVITDGANQRQIGRNCLANYLGLTNPQRLAEMAEILIDAADLTDMAEHDGFGDGGSYVPSRFPMDEVLAIAASAIRQYGWLSGKSAREFEKVSTSQRVSTWVTGSKKTREEFEHPLVVIDEDTTLATETMAWLETITDTDNEYMYNLSLLAKSSSIVLKNFGIGVSAINAYSRAKEREIRRNARIESDKNSEYVGEVGVRATFENLLVVFTTKFETDFGVTTLYKMKQGDNVVVYFSSRDLGYEQGQTLPKFIATIKKHELREEVKQTVITRGKEAPRDLSKEEKKEVNRLKREIKKLPYDAEHYAQVEAMHKQIDAIKNGMPVA